MSLDELKRAIEAVPELAPGVKAYVYQSRRADAWRAAFEWRDGYKNVDVLSVEGQVIFHDGMRLIRERLS